MLIVDVYNQKILVYGTIDASFVSEVSGEYSEFTIEYITEERIWHPHN